MSKGPQRFRDPEGHAVQKLYLWVSDNEKDIASSPVMSINSSVNVLFDNPIATGHFYFDLGTDTAATGFAIRNNSGTELLAVTGDGAVTIAGGISFALGDDDPLYFGAVPDANVTWVSATNLWVFDNTNVVGATYFDLGTNTNATEFAVRDNAGNRLLLIDGSGAISMVATTIDLDGTGAIGIESSAGAISVGADAVAQALNLGTGGARVIQIGSAAAASLALDAGIGGFTLLADTTVEIDAAGAITIESSAGTIGIGVDAVAQAVNIGTGGARQINIGSAAAAGIAMDAGIGAFALLADTTIDLDAAGAIGIESTAGAINIGADAVAQPVNIATGAAARVIQIGNAASASLALEAGVGAFTCYGDTTGNITMGTSLTLETPLVYSLGRLTTTDGVAGGNDRIVGGLDYAQVAASAGVGNTTTETFFNQTRTIPVNTLKAGSTIRIRAWGVTTASVGSTLIITGYIGGIAFMTSATIAQAANDEWAVDAILQVRTAGTGGTIVGTAAWHGPDAPGTVMGQANLASSAIDTTAVQLVRFSATWGAAATGDSVRQDGLIIDIV